MPGKKKYFLFLPSCENFERAHLGSLLSMKAMLIPQPSFSIDDVRQVLRYLFL